MEGRLFGVAFWFFSQFFGRSEGALSSIPLAET